MKYTADEYMNLADSCIDGTYDNGASVETLQKAKARAEAYAALAVAAAQIEAALEQRAYWEKPHMRPITPPIGGKS